MEELESYPEVLQALRLEDEVLGENFQAESSVSIQGDLCSVQELEDHPYPETVLATLRHHINSQKAKLLLPHFISKRMLDLFNAIVSLIMRVMVAFLGTERFRP